MKKLFWLATGVALGLVAAKEIEKNPRAKAAYNDATEKLASFAGAFLEGYRESDATEKPASKRSNSSKSA